MSATGLEEFTLEVSLRGADAVRYHFKQPHVLVGRGETCDLRIEHAAISGEQFVVEQMLGTSGNSRFRIRPMSNTTNAVVVNGHAAVEGALWPGDVIAVGDIRVTLVRKSERQRTFETPKLPNWRVWLTPTRLVLLALLSVMTLVVAYLFIADKEDLPPLDRDAALFIKPPMTLTPARWPMWRRWRPILGTAIERCWNFIERQNFALARASRSPIWRTSRRAKPN